MNKNRSRKTTLFTVLFVFATLFGGFGPVFAAEKDLPVIKAGVLNNTTFAFQDKKGVWRGSDVECLIDIAQLAGFRIEFIDSTTDVNILENLANGTYDILTDMAKGQKFKDDFLFSDEVVGTANNTIAVRANDKRWDYGDIKQLDMMKIGLVGVYETNIHFRTWCKEHGVHPKIIEYSDIKVMSAALESGAIDGELYLAVDGTEYTKQFRTILKLLPEPLYFAFRKDDVALKTRVDTALSQKLSANVDYLFALKSKYEAQFNSNILPFSSAEKNFIETKDVVHVAVVADDNPFYTKDADGSESGIIPDYYNLLADWSGLKFQYTAYATYEDAANAVKNGSADLLSFFSDGLVAAYENDFFLTNSIATISCVLLTEPGRASGIKNIAVTTRTEDSLQIAIGRLYPNATIHGYQGARDCYVSLQRGKNDAALLGMPSATWVMNQTNSAAYNLIPIPGITYELCMAVQSKNQLLWAILNKSIAATKGNFNGIVIRDTLPQRDWQTTISRIPPTMSALIVGILLTLLVGLTLAMFALRRRQQERTAMLAARSEVEQQRIRAVESQKNAEDKNAFFSNISHDMRTPLNAVIGFADLGTRTEDVGKKNEFLAKIKSAGKLLTALIDDTLLISRISSGKLHLEPEPTNFLDLLAPIMDTIRQMAEKKKITFSTDLSGSPNGMLLMDRLNVQKIALNLLSNAVKYTPEGGHVQLRAYAEASDCSHQYLIFEVVDDGIGISKAFLPHIFEPFNQERRHGYESIGTGLGLSIVRQLVKLMDGAISVQSEKDKGSRFTVRLRFRQIDIGAAPVGDKRAGQPVSLIGKKILVCEDNALNREIAVALLKSKGATVITTENGQLGLEAFARGAMGEFSAILMDIRMPVMDGLEATKAIRALERNDAKTIPIIAMTADAFAEDVQRCLAAGMNGHIAKPINPEKMFAILGNTISTEQPRKA